MNKNNFIQNTKVYFKPSKGMRRIQYENGAWNYYEDDNGFYYLDYSDEDKQAMAMIELEKQLAMDVDSVLKREREIQIELFELEKSSRIKLNWFYRIVKYFKLKVKNG